MVMAIILLYPMTSIMVGQHIFRSYVKLRDQHLVLHYNFDPLMPANMQIAPTKKVQLPDWKVALDFEVQVFNAS